MAGGRKRHSDEVWAEARKQHRLSRAQAEMARKLGMNPRKLGKIDNHKQAPWKLPLPLFIEKLYRKRFGPMPNSPSQGRRATQRRAATNRAPAITQTHPDGIGDYPQRDWTFEADDALTRFGLILGNLHDVPSGGGTGDGLPPDDDEPPFITALEPARDRNFASDLIGVGQRPLNRRVI